MTATKFAAYCRRIRLADDPATLTTRSITPKTTAKTEVKFPLGNAFGETTVSRFVSNAELRKRRALGASEAKHSPSARSEDISMIALNDFVKSTLVAIVRGVVDAQGETDSLGASVNPRQNGIDGNHINGTTIQDVHFDVAVTASESTAIDGGAKLNVTVLKAGVGTNSEASESSTSRIKFTVPVGLPSPSESAKRREAEGSTSSG